MINRIKNQRPTQRAFTRFWKTIIKSGTSGFKHLSGYNTSVVSFAYKDQHSTKLLIFLTILSRNFIIYLRIKYKWSWWAFLAYMLLKRSKKQKKLIRLVLLTYFNPNIALLPETSSMKAFCKMKFSFSKKNLSLLTIKISSRYFVRCPWNGTITSTTISRSWMKPGSI
jgi:hypothetical protein